MNDKFKLSKRRVVFSLSAVLLVGALLGGWLMRMPPEPRSNDAAQFETYGALPTQFATNLLPQISKVQLHYQAYRLKLSHLREISTQRMVNIPQSIEAAERINLIQMRQYQQRVGGSLESP